ncbi:MAG: killer suppression protein [Syntrophobacteraceae bacterium]|jgi:proteic killer suppression protein
MNIIFKSEKFAEECNQQEVLLQRHGRQRGNLIRRRLDDLRAAANLSDIGRIYRRCHELKGKRKGQLSLDLDGPHRLIFKVANDPIPIKADEGLDWTQVTSIEILGVEDTHE